jgi:hypothetical protein
VAEVLLSYLTLPLLELQQVVQVVLAIYLLAVQVALQRLLTQAVLAVAVAVSLPLAVTHLVTQVELVEMAGVVAVALTTLAHQVLAVMAYFIFTTKRGKQWQHMQ